jgi:hypothetical protein
LRIPEGDTYDDDYIQNLIYAASESVKGYIGDRSAYQVDLDEDDEPVAEDSNYFGVLESFDSNEAKSERVLARVKHATLLAIGEWYRYREGEGNNPDPNYLPRPIRALLYPLRDPTVK